MYARRYAKVVFLQVTERQRKLNKLPHGNSPRNGDDKSKFAMTLVKQIMARPEAQVERESFLRKQLRSHCPEEQVTVAIASNPANAQIPIYIIDRIADGVIKSHVVNAGIGSFAAGILGGFAMLATIPADTIQFFWHAVMLAQKLAYLYGWPDMLEAGEVDDETEIRILMLLGSMLGVGQANNALKAISQGFAQQVATRVPRQALTKTFYYPAVKTALKWIGIKVTKQSFAKGVSKLVPVLGGVTSAGLTTLTLRPMARRLKKHLRELEFAQHERHSLPPDIGK